MYIVDSAKYKFTFGKHKDKDFLHILNTYPNYIKYLINEKIIDITDKDLKSYVLDVLND